MAVMKKAKQDVAVSRKRSTRVSLSRQDLIDERVIAEAHDESAWDAPVDVKRRGTSADMRANPLPDALLPRPACAGKVKGRLWIVWNPKKRSRAKRA